jgi:predicted amidohydrolase YtcJ
MREAHAHLPWHARALPMVRLDDCTSADECLDRLATASNTLAPGEWLLAISARVQSWLHGQWPSLAQIDRAAGDHPCVVMSFDFHSALANTRALHASRVVTNTPDGGVVCRDEHDNPTGVLLELAAQLAFNTAPEPTPEQWGTLIPAALQDLARHGFTEVHDLLAPPWLGPLLADLDRRGQLSTRIRLYAPLASLDSELARSRDYTTARVSLAGGKIFADGTINSRTAWMIHDYPDPINGLPRGKVITSQDDIARALEHTARLNLQLAVHAIGDGAVRATLDAAHSVSSSRRLSVSHLRIEHCEFIDVADVPRFAELGVTASVQPCHLLADIEGLNRHFPHRLDRVLPLRELIASGLEPGKTLLFGSDVPVVRPDPDDSIQAAVHRRRVDQPPSETIAPDQAITESQARACFGP